MGKHQSFFVTGEPMIYGADVAIVLSCIAIIFTLTYLKKWKWLWENWLTTVDHKKIGIMYILCAVVMLFRGGVDALLMRTQLTLPGMNFLDAQHYDEIFTTHGVIMILFMAMPFLIGLVNVVVPLQIGARDVAFPYLNAISFWLFFAGAMLFNISFVIGGSPDGGWTEYFPYAGTEYTSGVGNNYYAIAIQIAGIGTLLTGVNFITTILKMRTPGMKLWDMPLFTWSVIPMMIIVIFAFPVYTIGLLEMALDRIFGSHFFTLGAGGMPMLWNNIFWIWGHPEVYIVVLPAFGIYSEIMATFAGKKVFGKKGMVFSMIAIAITGYVTWVHHFFTMGNTVDVNDFFSVSTMLVGVPTGVKMFNWIATLYKGKIRWTVPMLWTMWFIPNFVVGGATGVMLAASAADFQYHNSYFLVAHFHQVLIAGVVFAVFGGLTYWWPKMFGYLLNERLGKHTFWWFMIGFNVCFYPQYWLGLDGMTRRVYTYVANEGWTTLNIISTVGGFMMGVAFLILCYNILWSLKHGERDVTGDPWNARTLEWATHTPVPEYNFATLPEIKGEDFWWKMKREKIAFPTNYQPIHMPNNSGIPIIMAGFFFVGGFGLVFGWMWMAIIALIGVLFCLAARSLENDHGRHIHVEEIEKIEKETGGMAHVED